MKRIEGFQGQPKRRGRKPGSVNKKQVNGQHDNPPIAPAPPKPFGARLMKIADIPPRSVQTNDPEIDELFKVLENLKPGEAYAIPAKNSTVKVLACKVRRWIRVRVSQSKYATSSCDRQGEVYVWLREDKALKYL